MTTRRAVRRYGFLASALVRAILYPLPLTGLVLIYREIRKK